MEPLYKVTKAAVKSEDYIPDQEWRQLTRTSEHLAEEWRKAGHKAFDDSPRTGPISTTLRTWEMFCYSKWASPTDVSSVRAFMEAAISAKISDEIKKAFGRQIISSNNLRSRAFYDYFYSFAISYLNDNYTDSVYVTSVLQRILNLSQGASSLSDHLQAAEELIEELKFCASSRVVQLDIDHLSNSLMMSLGEPFRGWYYEELKVAVREGSFGSLDSIVDVCKVIKRRSRTLGPERPYSYPTSSSSSSKVPTSAAQVSSVGLNPGECVTVLDGQGGATSRDTVPNKSAKQNNQRPKGCRRCYQQGHFATACTADSPQNLHKRCRCGASTHTQDQCKLPVADLKCERCGNSTSLADQKPHRSGVCPYSLDQIKDVKGKAPSPDESQLAHIDGIDPQSLPNLEICTLELSTGSSGGTSSLSSSSLSTERLPSSPSVVTPPSSSAVNALLTGVCSASTGDRVAQPCTPIIVGLPSSSLSTVTALALWDTGASGTFIRSDVLEKLANKAGLQFKRPSTPSTPVCATLADSQSQIKLLGVCSITLASPKAATTVQAYVTDQLSYPVVIGVPTLFALKARLDFGNDGIVKITTGCSDAVDTSTSTADSRAEPISASCVHLVAGSGKLEEDTRLWETFTPIKGELSCAHLRLDVGQRRSEFADALPCGDNLRPCPHDKVVEQRSPARTVQLDITREGRYVVDFLPQGIEEAAGLGWKTTVTRAARSLRGRTTDELSQIGSAIDKLLTSGYVGHMPLRFTGRVPPRSVFHNLYAHSPLIRTTHLAYDSYYDRCLPTFVPSQYVFKGSSSTTPCRIVYDARWSNRMLSPPSTTRWNLMSFLITTSSKPCIHYMDISAAFNQILWTPRSSALCATVLQRPRGTGDHDGVPILVVWASMAFGLSNSPCGLEVATAGVELESLQLGSALSVPSEYVNTHSCARPDFYSDTTFNYCRPIIDAAFDCSPVSFDLLYQGLLWEPCWEDYVDDWQIAGDHVCQVQWNKDLRLGVAGHRGFTFSDAKQFSTWSLGEPDSHSVLGYRVTCDDHLLPILDIEELSLGASKHISSIPCGDGLCGSRLLTGGSSCPISPKLLGRGGLFPNGKNYSSTSDSLIASRVGTTPRKELHALLKGSEEAVRLDRTCSLGDSTMFIICTDSLINLQRLRWLGSMSEETARLKVRKEGRKRQLSEHDLRRLVQVRALLLSLCAPVTVVHVPSSLNVADAASRCLRNCDVDFAELNALLDNIHLRPYYIPVSVSTFDDITQAYPEEAEEPVVDDVACILQGLTDEEVPLCTLTPQPGQMPVPLPECDELPKLTDDDKANLDEIIRDSIQQDGEMSAVFAFLTKHKHTGHLSPDRVRRLSNSYLVEDGKLYRHVLQRPDGTVVHQRVVGRGARDLQHKIIFDLHIRNSHLGSRGLTRLVQETYYWTGLEKVVRDALTRCRPCLRTRSLRCFNSSAGVKHVENLLPGQVLGVDLYLPQVHTPNTAGRGSSKRGDVSACLVLTDMVSGFLTCQVLTGSVTSSTIISALSSCFSNTIRPAILMHDNAKVFLSRVVSDWLSSRGVQQLAAPLYAPELCFWERSHRELTQSVKAVVNDASCNKLWWQAVVEACDTLNDVPIDQHLWVSPRMLMFPHYNPQAFYDQKNASVESLHSRLVPVDDSRSAQRLRETATISHRASVLEYLRHWQDQRERSRCRVLYGARNGKQFNLPVGSSVYHYVTSGSKLQGRMKGPFRVAAAADGATVLLQGFNGQCFKAWVTNVVPIPPWPSSDAEGQPLGEDHHHNATGVETAQGCQQYLSRLPFEWNLDDLPPLLVLPPP
ncbi:hypothetical protein FOZ61_000422, partial [Perkinsus olseni]